MSCGTMLASDEDAVKAFNSVRQVPTGESLQSDHVNAY